jgi:hypothetical protein
LVRVGLAVAAVSWVGEGYLERRLLGRAFRHRESTPGQSKIIEHFAVQHVFFPALATALAIAPGWALELLRRSRSLSVPLAMLSAVLCVPELQVSLRSADGPGDLFRPYPFPLSARIRRIEMVHVGGRDVNVIQATHLGLNHLLFTGVLAGVAFGRRR